MNLRLKFNPKELEEINKYLVKWDKWRRDKKVGLPDWTDYNIMLLPLTIALIKSSNNLKWITWILLGLTLILSIETAFLIFL